MTEMNVTIPPAREALRGTDVLAIVREYFLRHRAIAAAPVLTPIQCVRRERARAALRLGDAALESDRHGASRSDEASAALAVSLYREAAFWALAARATDASPKTLSDAFELAPGSVDDEVVRAALLDRTWVDTAELDAESQLRDATAASTFVHGLLEALDARERSIAERWTRISALCLVLFFATVGYPLATLALRPGLTETLPWSASSAIDGFAREGRGIRLPTAGARVFFHTENQASPWVAFDLVTRQSVRSVTVQNRGDCCRERAVPLVVEVSDDGAQWTEVARRDEVFDEWAATFPPRTTRHVRLRALRTTNLHLANVEIR